MVVSCWLEAGVMESGVMECWSAGVLVLRDSNPDRALIFFPKIHMNPSVIAMR